MNRYYLAKFSETVIEDGVARPVLPWDGLSVNAHCVYPRAEKGVYLESHVIALIAADAKAHEQIAANPGVTILPDDASMKLSEIPQDKRAEVEQKAAELKVDASRVTQDATVKEVADMIGKKLKPTFDLARLSVVSVASVDKVL